MKKHLLIVLLIVAYSLAAVGAYGDEPLTPPVMKSQYYDMWADDTWLTLNYPTKETFLFGFIAGIQTYALIAYIGLGPEATAQTPAMVKPGDIIPILDRYYSSGARESLAKEFIRASYEYTTGHRFYQ